MNQLKEIRLIHGWTQQYVADKTGITKAAYSNIETQKRKPSLKVAVQLYKMFGIPVENML